MFLDLKEAQKEIDKKESLNKTMGDMKKQMENMQKQIEITNKKLLLVELHEKKNK